MDLRQIKTTPEEFGLMTYDPAFMNTASCKSAITFIDGDKGILRYRGYPIEQLAEKSTFLEVAWLLRNGELPTQSEYDQWVHDITYHTYVHENIKTFLQGFRYDAHPMSMLCSAVAALSSFYPEAKNIHDPRIAEHLDHPPAREAADARRVLLSPQQGPAVHLSRQRSELRREFPLDGRAHVGAEVRGESGVREGARDSVHPPRRSRAELLDERGARGRLIARRSVLGDRGRRRGAVRSAARRRERAGAAHDQGDRPPEERSGVHRRGEGRQGRAG